jgi:aconitate hydratase
MEAQGRAENWSEWGPDPDARYTKTVTINLAEIEPLAAAPHSPDNVVTVGSLEGTKVDQVLIGSCTNSSYRDLKTVARILAGRKVHPDVTLGIAAGSRQVLMMLDREKSLGDLLQAGARILENACGFCIGNSMAPGTDAVSLRTINRNFEGRSGTASARVYLVSPETAAVAALYGRIMDPRHLTDLPYPRVRMPKLMTVDDSMFVRPPEDPSRVKVARGPNIGAPPRNSALPEEIAGVATIKVGDKITTDHIMPAGPRLKHRSNVPAYSAYVLEAVDTGFAERAAKIRDAGRHNVIVAGESYGQGSSREHAAMCPMFLGVRAVVAKSIERIHMANLINFGILPLTFENAADYARLEAGDEIRIGEVRKILSEGQGRLMLKNVARGADIPLTAAFTDRQRSILLAGGLLNLAKVASDGG